MSLPVVHELSSPIDAFEAARRLSRLPHVLFLDSAARRPDRGMTSYVTADPFEIVLSAGDRLRLIRRVPSYRSHDSEHATCERTEYGRADPFSLVATRLSTWAHPEIPGISSFQGGAAGLFGYGLSRAVERVPAPRTDEFGVPDLFVGIYDWALSWDHASGACHLVAQGFPARDSSSRRRNAERRIAQISEMLRSSPRSASGRGESARAAAPRQDLSPSWPVPGMPELLSNFSRDAYMAAVRRVVEYIRAGDVFQVNLSQRLVTPATIPALDFYERLRAASPSAFAAYFDMGNFAIASSSPEHFLEATAGRVVTRPVKGTRPRGSTPEADRALQLELERSAKDRSENVMIVDLLRNDLSRVCRPGSVRASRLFELETLPTLHHLVSEVRGELRAGTGPMDLLRAAFPGGSVTGAPKVRAMEIIAELEPTARGPYCGSIGWIAFHGSIATNILIRTVTIGKGWMQLPVGGGVVADSDPEEEYEETLVKARGMERAVVAARE